MGKSELQVLLEKGLSTRQISKEVGKSRSTVSYWIKKYDLRCAYEKYGKGRGVEHKCGTCGETDASKFYGHKKSICGKCHNRYTLKIGQEKRQYAIDSMGGKCVICGYNDFICSIDIHHLDPSIKDMNFDSMRSWCKERIDKEIENCVPLCRNCHSALHNGKISLLYT